MLSGGSFSAEARHSGSVSTERKAGQVWEVRPHGAREGCVLLALGEPHEVSSGSLSGSTFTGVFALCLSSGIAEVPPGEATHWNARWFTEGDPFLDTRRIA